MSEEERIKIKLKHQTDLIMEILRSLEYLINFPRYLDISGNDKPKDLWFLYNVIRNNTIINLHKIFNQKEDYSFNQITLLVLKKYDKHQKDISNYLILLKNANRLYDKLDVRNIRNTHVGHLDEKREYKTIDWTEVLNLTNLACDTHDSLNIFLFRTQNGWFVENKILNSIFTNDLRSIKLFELKRKIFRKNLQELERDEILNLTKIYWP